MKIYLNFVVNALLIVSIIIVLAIPIVPILIKLSVGLANDTYILGHVVITLAMEISTILTFIMIYILSLIKKDKEVINELFILSKKITLLFTFLAAINIIKRLYI